jgi:hypothetical protein
VEVVLMRSITECLGLIAHAVVGGQATTMSHMFEVVFTSPSILMPAEATPLLPAINARADNLLAIAEYSLRIKRATSKNINSTIYRSLRAKNTSGYIN